MYMSETDKEYKCIYCGKSINAKKQCSCPECGYLMFPMPYVKKDILIKEIMRFIKCLELTDITESDFHYIGKETDDNRFPNYKKIRNYICSSDKTETFFERVNQSLDQIEKYIQTPFKNQYIVDYLPLKKRVEGMESVLQQVLNELKITCDFDPIIIPKINGDESSASDIEIFFVDNNNSNELTWPVAIADYLENPQVDLLEIAEELLTDLKKLSGKLYDFIKLNNIYGKDYKQYPDNISKKEKKTNSKENLTNCKSNVEAILNKHYFVDLTSDGSEEQEEMLNALWDGISTVLMASVLQPKLQYKIGHSELLTKEDFDNNIKTITQKRYLRINFIFLEDSFLEAKSETELFELYDKLIQFDTFGFLSTDASNLKKAGENEKKLNSLIGLHAIKESITKIKAYALKNKDNNSLNLHMCFYGNPGTGKTEVARIIAGILYENGILPTKNVIEVDRAGLVGEYVGETPQKTLNKVKQAMGGVLFVDEAYSLVPSSDSGFDYGHEAIATLIKAMEDYRGKFCVILAGYKNPMEHMIATNPGFKSRIQFELNFSNYSREELNQILDLMLKQKNYSISITAREKLLDVMDVKRKAPNFANARELRNCLDSAIMCQNVRCINSDDREITLVDINKFIKDSGLSLPSDNNGSPKRILTGEEELDALIGLSTVKRTLRKIKAYAKRNISNDIFNLHMIFTGNPGTGKTEVARILSRILYDAGVLPEAKLVETDATGLIGKYVGETGEKTLSKIEEAMGGVLFIDEAYALSLPNSGYGEEAIAVLLKEMEDKRGKICVILAGYREEMEKLLAVNPGFESRIQFTLDFPDYSKDELAQIMNVFLSKLNYRIDEAASDRILDLAEWYRNRENFANARTIRNILNQAIMNQNLRTEEINIDDYTITKADVDEYIEEIGISL